MKFIHRGLSATAIFLLLAFPVFLQAAAGDTLKGSALYPFGRYATTGAGELELISSGVHFGFRFEGPVCQVFVSNGDPNGHSYLQYTLDGVYHRKMKISGGLSRRYIIDGIGQGRHEIWIYKATEAATGPVYVQKIVAPRISPVREPVRPIIEFIGNSITCGAAADPSDIPCGTGEYHDQHNVYFSYGPRVARTLNVNFLLSSVSGIGIYRNWNSLSPVMPQVYEKTDFQLNSPRNWDFTRYRPRIVSIALGTNDFSDGDGHTPRLPFDSARYVSGFIGFVKLVRSKYPDARIALLSSPMLNGAKREMLQRCLTAVKKNIDAAFPSKKPVALFFFAPMKARGCTGHPNVEDHAILAGELEPFYKKLL